MTLKQIVKQYLEADGYNALKNIENNKNLCICRVDADLMKWCIQAKIDNSDCKPWNTEVA